MAGETELRTIADLLPRMGSCGDREALRFFDGYRLRVLTYRHLLELAEGFNAVLESAGVERGQRVVLWGRNSPEWVAAFWAVVSRGAVAVPLDAGSTPDLAARLARRAEAALVLRDDGLAHPALGPPARSLDRVSPDLPRLALDPRNVEPSDVVEIVYTSGTTGEPRGVPHRHRNLTANLNPVAAEIERYRWLAKPFQPVRILNLLPLSHLFGQAMSLFVSPLLGGATVLTGELKPSQLVETIRRQRVSVLVGVPRQLRQLAAYLEAQCGKAPPVVSAHPLVSVPVRWWRCRRHHRALGWKFWAAVVGGARVGADIEEFWDRIGVALIQGYGLTEASPIVALNHPFHRRRGSLGEVVAGQEVQIAEDGEILVRGDNVVSGYQDGESLVDSEGWLHTGDLGRLDADGRLYFQGRKKDVIVTSSGLNVFPADVENVLRSLAGVRDCVVVGVSGPSGEEVHAAVLAAGGGRLDRNRLRGEANRRLEAHQRLKRITLWPGDDFPRTSTAKVRRAEVRRLLNEQQVGVTPVGPPAGLALRLLGRISGIAPEEILPASRLEEDLGLSSLDRIELLSRLEIALQADLDEGAFSRLRTVSDVEECVRTVLDRSGEEEGSSKAQAGPISTSLPPPRWNRLAPVRLVRRICQSWLFLPLFRHYLPLEVCGLQNLRSQAPPLLLAANHSSHLDTVAVLASLPPAWRRRVAPAVRQEFFFEPPQALRSRALSRFLYWLACGLFNTYPLPQRSGGIRQLVRYSGELADAGCCPLVFPEGRRTADGRLLPFQAGIGLLATRLRLAVMPIYLEGLFAVMSQFDSWPRPGPVRVTFGPAVAPLPAETAEAFTERLQATLEGMAAPPL